MKRIVKVLAIVMVLVLSLASFAAFAEGRIKTTGNVNFRKGAGLGYASRGTISSGVTLSYDKTSKDDRGVTWYRVSYNGRTGWVSSKYAKKVNGSGSPMVVGSSGKSNVRKGPGLGYKSVGTLHRDESATYLNESAVDERGVAWYKISFKGATAWVSSKYTKVK